MKHISIVKIKDGRIEFQPYSKLMFVDYVKKSGKERFRLTLETERQPKSEKCLGFYFAGVVTAIVAHDRGLVHKGEVKNNPLILGELCRAKKITAEEIY